MKSVSCVIVSVMLAALVLSFTGIAVAEDDEDKNSIFKGSYLYSGNVYCVTASTDVVSGEGFYPDPNLRLRIGGSTSSTVVQGEYVFNGDGTGSRSVDWLVILNYNLGPNQRPLNYGTSYADFDYTVNMDGTFEMTSGVTTVDKRYGNPKTQTIDDFATSTGAIAAGQKTFTLADTNPKIETISRGEDPDIIEIERICNRTGIGIKIQ
jgi:hypothetical protein